MKDIDQIRREIERLSYLSDVYENLKKRAKNCSVSESQDLKLQLDIAKKEIMQISYLIDKKINSIM